MSGLIVKGSLAVVDDPRVQAYITDRLSSLGDFDELFLFERKEDDQPSGALQFSVRAEVLDVGAETLLLQLLRDLGQAVPGRVVGELEVWWSGCVDSGPQWWILEPDGQLFIQESEVVRGEKNLYGE